MTTPPIEPSETTSRLPLVVLLGTFAGLLAGDFGIPLEAFGFGSLEIRWLLPTALAPMALVLLRDKAHPATQTGRSYLVSIVVLFVYLATTSLWSPTGADLVHIFADFSAILLYVAIGAIATSRMAEPDWFPFWVSVVVVGILFALTGIAAGLSSGERMSAFGSGPNVFVRIVGMAILVTLLVALRSANIRWLIPVVPLVAATIMSGSRGGMIAVALSAAVAVVLGRNWLVERRRALVFSTASLLLLLAIVSIFGEALGQVIGTRFGEQLFSEGQTSGRDRLYEAGLGFWNSAPFLGNGIGSFSVFYGHGFTYTHNIIVDTLVDGGVLGLSALAAPLLIATRRVKLARQSPSVAISLSVALMYFIASQFSGGYYDTRFVWFFLVIGCWSHVPGASSDPD